MLTKSQRLRENRDFKRVYSQGRSYVHPLLVLHVHPARGAGRRIGFSISKKLGGAVERNRVKRRLREACRARIAQIRAGHDMIFVGRSGLKSSDFQAIREAVDFLLEKARLLTPQQGQEEP